MSESFEAWIVPEGTIECIYSDVIDLRELGHVRAERASDVVWSEAGQCWVIEWQCNSAFDVEVARDRFRTGHGFALRAEAIASEVDAINSLLEEKHS